MTLNAAAIEVLLAKGLTGADILEVARALESRAPNADATAEKRRAYDRERKREKRKSGGMSTGNPPGGFPNDIDILTPSTSIANAIADPEKILFDSGVSLLTSTGTAESKARSLLGKWKRDYGVSDVITALGTAKREGAIEPVAFIEATLRTRAKQQAPPAWDGMP